jgi:hypothetical protein
MIVLIIYFSATWPEDVRRIAARYMRNPIQIYVGTLDLAVCIFYISIFCHVYIRLLSLRLYTVSDKILKLLKKKKNLIW